MIGASTPSAQDVETYVKKHQVCFWAVHGSRSSLTRQPRAADEDRAGDGERVAHRACKIRLSRRVRQGKEGRVALSLFCT